ncbi:hypothetical protein V1509DRAFT_630944 [Lipomyces kononenkoae]
MVFGTPDSDVYSNYRYMNLSSMRVTNLEQSNVSVLLQFLPPFAHGGDSYAYETYEFQVPQGSSMLLIDGLEKAGLTYVQTLIFSANTVPNNGSASGAASLALDDISIVVPQTSPSSHTYSPTPLSTGCPTTAVTSCVACAPPTPTATTQVLTFDNINTGPSGSVPMKVHYEGFNFHPNASVVRSPGNNEYGSKRSSGPNALVGVPNQNEGFGGISFSSEQYDTFNISGFYVTIFNLSDPTVAPNKPASLQLSPFGGNLINYLTVDIPTAEEMYKVNATAIGGDSVANIYAVTFQATFNDSSPAGIILDSIEFASLHYPGLSNSTCSTGLRTLTFDDINTNCGKGNISAPATYDDFRLHYPESPYEEPSPWNVIAASLFPANSSEALVAHGSRNILYGTTGMNGPFGNLAILDDGRPTVSLLIDEQQSLKSNGDFDFDLVSMRLGMDTIDTVPNAFEFDVTLDGYDKCGNHVAQIARKFVPFPGTGGTVTQFTAGMFAEQHFVGLRKVQITCSTTTLPPEEEPVLWALPFWIDSVEYRRSD